MGMRIVCFGAAYRNVHTHTRFVQYTVDGRNLAPPGMYKNHVNNENIYHINWLAGFLNHQQYGCCVLWFASFWPRDSDWINTIRNYNPSGWLPAWAGEAAKSVVAAGSPPQTCGIPLRYNTWC